MQSPAITLSLTVNLAGDISAMVTMFRSPLLRWQPSHSWGRIRTPTHPPTTFTQLLPTQSWEQGAGHTSGYLTINYYKNQPKTYRKEEGPNQEDTGSMDFHSSSLMKLMKAALVLAPWYLLNSPSLQLENNTTTKKSFILYGPSTKCSICFHPTNSLPSPCLFLHLHFFTVNFFSWNCL